MNGILDSILKKSQVFAPETLEGYIALQLARALSDTGDVWKYLALFDHLPLAAIVTALNQARTRHNTPGSLPVIFEREINRLIQKGGQYAA
jgi:hypothetical protein